MCAWMITNFLLQTNWRRRLRRRRGRTKKCNARVKNSIQQGNGWASNNKTRKKYGSVFFFQGACVLRLVFIAFMKNVYLRWIARRSNWMTRTTLALLFITHHHLEQQHHLFTSASMNLYARAKIEINEIESQKRDKKK